jgi:hypothetical protein
MRAHIDLDRHRRDLAHQTDHFQRRTVGVEGHKVAGVDPVRRGSPGVLDLPSGGGELDHQRFA